MPAKDNDTSPKSQDAIAAPLALIAAIRDNVYLEQWALDELLDMQPSNEHAKAPGLALGQASALVRPPLSGGGPVGCSPAVQAVWEQIFKRRDRQELRRNIAMREAAGILDPEIQALTSCSPVYRMHLQMQKDERAESIIQKLRDRIGELERLGGI